MYRPLARFFCLAVVLFSFAGAPSANQSALQETTQSETNSLARLLASGRSWSSLSFDKKWDFVDGYVTAMTNLHQKVLQLIREEKKRLASGDGDFNAHVKALTYLTLLADQYDYRQDRIKLVAGIDDFYKDPRNARIGIELALQFVRDTLNGKNTPKDLERELNEWRAIVDK